MDTYSTRRRNDAKAYLGGVCARCGATTDLQFDHVDPATKEIDISQAIVHHWSWNRLVVELDKCQLLCVPHHREKTRTESHGGQNRIIDVRHGTAKMYGTERCRCDICREWKREYRAGRVDSLGRITGL